MPNSFLHLNFVKKHPINKPDFLNLGNSLIYTVYKTFFLSLLLQKYFTLLLLNVEASH